MSFEEPWRLAPAGRRPLALLVAYVLAQRSRRKYALRFTSVDLLASVAPRRPGWQRHISAALMLAAVLALVVGFAGRRATKKVAAPARHDHARDRHVGFDGRDRRRAEPARRRRGRGPALRRRAARGPEGRAAVVRHQRARRVVRRRPTTRPCSPAIDTLDDRRRHRDRRRDRPVARRDRRAAEGRRRQKAPRRRSCSMSDGSPTIGRNGAVARGRPSQAATAAAKAGAGPGRHDRVRHAERLDRRSRARSCPVPADPQTMAADRVGQRRQVVHGESGERSSTRCTTRSARASATTRCAAT